MKWERVARWGGKHVREKKRRQNMHSQLKKTLGKKRVKGKNEINRKQ